MSKVFVNFSNHPSSTWDSKQKEEAEKYGSIVDYSFPQVDPCMSDTDVMELAEKCVKGILALSPAAVMCQGEFNLAYAVIHSLMGKGIPVVAACSARNVEYTEDEQGEVKKVVRFSFEQFRKYVTCK